MKRKIDDLGPTNGASKKRAVSEDEAKDSFRKDLFRTDVLEEYQGEYATSQPYKHGVIRDVMNDTLLRKVREEILEHLHFTPKETDIYKIHQSGDLANLDGLEDSSLTRLPSLLGLRDALYSSTFRKYISKVADAGPLSGKKTDMAINVYTPGCHLLCHDDVIGSRRLSYILYLTDPDKPWKAEWGGALRLYPTDKLKGEDGNESTVPAPDFCLSIPPSFNQLSFFTIQPGQSFHDVEEVYKRKEDDGTDDNDDGGRMRMAISGWFHIPQEGEEGYEEGLEEKLAERSSLSQLQSKSDEFDLPQPRWKPIEQNQSEYEDDFSWTEEDLNWLVRFINPVYLMPDTIEELSENFQENSVITLANFLHPKLAEKLQEYIVELDSSSPAVIPGHKDGEKDVGVARPPHKHRFLFRQAASTTPSESDSDTPLDQILDHLFPSRLFSHWLSLVTNLPFSQGDFLARRFRKGWDYTLATSYDEPEPQLEISLGITPSPGWGDDDAASEDEEEDEIPAKLAANNGKAKPKDANGADGAEDEDTVGGYEIYMAGDDDDEDGEQDEAVGESSNTGAGQRKKAKADPAVYKSSSGDDEDDAVLFTNPASWNSLSIVLRDRGLLRFVKYVSASAKGDRWDVVGNFSVVPDGETVDDDDDNNE